MTQSSIPPGTISSCRARSLRLPAVVGATLAERMTAALETGGVFINGYCASDPRVAFGGVKKSGFGRELSHFGVREFTNAQTVWLDRN